MTSGPVATMNVEYPYQHEEDMQNETSFFNAAEQPTTACGVAPLRIRRLEDRRAKVRVGCASGKLIRAKSERKFVSCKTQQRSTTSQRNNHNDNNPLGSTSEHTGRTMRAPTRTNRSIRKHSSGKEHTSKNSELSPKSNRKVRDTTATTLPSSPTESLDKSSNNPIEKKEKVKEEARPSSSSRRKIDGGETSPKRSPKSRHHNRSSNRKTKDHGATIRSDDRISPKTPPKGVRRVRTTGSSPTGLVDKKPKSASRRARTTGSTNMEDVKESSSTDAPHCSPKSNQENKETTLDLPESPKIDTIIFPVDNGISNTTVSEDPITFTKDINVSSPNDVTTASLEEENDDKKEENLRPSRFRLSNKTLSVRGNLNAASNHLRKFLRPNSEDTTLLTTNDDIDIYDDDDYDDDDDEFENDFPSMMMLNTYMNNNNKSSSNNKTQNNNNDYSESDDESAYDLKASTNHNHGGLNKMLSGVLIGRK